MNLPRILKHSDNNFFSVGKGTSPETFAYMERATGKLVDMFVVTVFQTGSYYSLAHFRGSRMPAIRIDHSALAFVGGVSEDEKLLVGPLTFLDNLPSAEHAWRIKDPSSVETRLSGTVTHIGPSGTWGYIRSISGTEFFVHRSDIRDGKLFFGRRVSYKTTEGGSGRGPKAIDVTAS